MREPAVPWAIRAAVRPARQEMLSAPPAMDPRSVSPAVLWTNLAAGRPETGPAQPPVRFAAETRLRQLAPLVVPSANLAAETAPAQPPMRSALELGEEPLAKLVGPRAIPAAQSIPAPAAVAAPPAPARELAPRARTTTGFAKPGPAWVTAAPAVGSATHAVQAAVAAVAATTAPRASWSALASTPAGSANRAEAAGSGAVRIAPAIRA